MKVSTIHYLLKKLWPQEHRGVFTKIAREHGVSRGMVRKVYWGEKRSHGGRIERALRRAGAPYVEVPKKKRSQSQKNDARERVA